MAAQIKTYHGACPHDCPDTCAFVYTVENDRLISVKGAPEHPMTAGGLCVKLKDYDERHYNADRILFPLKRNGPKGSRQYVRITWESALAEIKQRWTEIIKEHGAESILPLSYLGNQGLVHGITAGDAFFNKLGATVCEKTYCGSGSSTAGLLTVGPTGGVDPESFVHSKYIVIWACNTLSTNLHHWPFIKRAQENSAKIVVIDAYKSRTAKHADWHIGIKPGTDGARDGVDQRAYHREPARPRLHREVHDRLRRVEGACAEVHAGVGRDHHRHQGPRHPQARA